MTEPSASLCTAPPARYLAMEPRNPPQPTRSDLVIRAPSWPARSLRAVVDEPGIQDAGRVIGFLQAAHLVPARAEVLLPAGAVELDETGQVTAGPDRHAQVRHHGERLPRLWQQIGRDARGGGHPHDPGGRG